MTCELVIKFHADVPESVIDLILDNYESDRVHTIDAIGWHKLVVAEEHAERILAELRLDPAVKTVFHNHAVRPGSITSVTPNDPWYSGQWQLQAMSVPKAWGLGKGKASTIISLGDTQFELGHPDFKDEQGNSRFLPGTNTYDSPPSSVMTGGNDWHGMKVAGVGTASGNNAKGVAGINWNCKVIPFKIGNYTNGWSTPYAVALSITMAADQGSRIHNLSWGLGDGDTQGEPVEFYQDAIDYALTGGTSGSKGCVVTIIAGNRDQNTYPTQDQLQRCLIVGASTQDGHRIDYSTFGSWVTLVAPIGGPSTRTYAYRPITYGPGVSTTSYTLQGGYVDDFSGTSASTPEVWGNGSLALGECDNDISPFQLMALMKYATDGLDGRHQDEFFSAGGQTNAYIASKTAQLALPGAAPRPTVIMATPRHASVVYSGFNDTVHFEALVFDENPVQSVSLYVDGSETPFATVTQEPYIIPWPAVMGAHTFQLKATSASGVGTSEINTVTVLPADSTAPPYVGIASQRQGQTVSGTIYVNAIASVHATLVKDASNIWYGSPYIDTLNLRLLQNGVQIAALPQVTAGGIYGYIDIPANVTGPLTLEATAVASNGLTTTSTVDLVAVAPLDALTANNVTVTPVVAPASLVGVLAVDSVTITPSATVATLTAASASPLAADDVTITPAVSVADLIGTVATDDVTITPVISTAELTVTVLTGAGSIRSPGGAFLDLRAPNGQPLTVMHRVNGVWQ